MTTITDEYMQGMLAKTKPYTIVLLKAGPKADNPQKMKAEDADFRRIIWEHGRRNFALREEGVLSIVAPVTTEADVLGLYIFNTDAEAALKILSEDPAVQAGIFVCHAYPCMSFPGDKLA
jgi:hypothetical protein